MDTDLHQWPQQNDMFNSSRWGDVGGYTNGEGLHNATLTDEYTSDSLSVPPVPNEPTHIVPRQPQYSAHGLQSLAPWRGPMATPASASTALPAVTPVTTIGGSTPRRTLTDDDRRRICEYHKSHPGVKQTEIGAMFGVERSTISKILRQKEKFLSSDDRSQDLAEKPKNKFPDIERTLANWANNQQIKGEPLNDSKLQEQAQRFAVTIGNPESLFNLELFKRKYNITVEPGALVKSEGQDENTPRMSDCSAATPVSDSAIEESPTAINPQQMVKRNKSVTKIQSARSTSMQPLPRSENISLVSSGSPTQDDARRALDLVWRFFQNQPAGFLEADESAIIDRLIAKLSLTPKVSKKRRVEATNAGLIVGLCHGNHLPCLVRGPYQNFPQQQTVAGRQLPEDFPSWVFL